MKPAIKICGLSTPESIRTSLENRADMLGFIFFQKSPRNVSVSQAAVLRQLAIGKAETVAVTVEADDALLDTIVSGMKPDWLQLHGEETAERVMEVKARYGLPVMKAFSVREAGDLGAIASYLGIADRLLFDAKAPKGSDLPGGNGVSFDWRLLATLDPKIDYMLSGGLNAGNVRQALAITNAPGLDVSSGVESAPGIKDNDLIKDFFAAVKNVRPGATQ